MSWANDTVAWAEWKLKKLRCGPLLAQCNDRNSWLIWYFRCSLLEPQLGSIASQWDISLVQVMEDIQPKKILCYHTVGHFPGIDFLSKFWCPQYQGATLPILKSLWEEEVNLAFKYNCFGFFTHPNLIKVGRGDTSWRKNSASFQEVSRGKGGALR